MRLLGASDLPDITAFCQANCEKLMFPWSNLLRYGIAGGHGRAMTFWANDTGPITDLLGINDEGIVMLYCPNACSEAADTLRGRSVVGFLGDSEGVARVRQELGLAPAQLDGSEPQYNLELTDLIMPDVTGLSLHPLGYAPRTTLIEWRAAYSVESLSVPGVDATEKAEADIENYLAQNSHRVLYAGNTPVAMTGFNASAPGIVQIGGVYTPPPLRARGYARKALALHLVEAQADCITRATLFAANVAAEKAYQALGFQQSGRFTIAIYETPQHV